jgi:nitroimidazol reductase NimA-like FMN-containing flavoprotein (pyridoxamine 5'-phosphate oxidase superfamily)
MDSPHLERLTAAECRRLLPGASVGRLVLPTPNFPTVEPVAFAPVDDGVAVIVRAGSAGDAAAPGTPVAFEADVLDHDLRHGWSVVVKGPLVALDAALVESVTARLTPWPVAPGDRILLVRSERTTGQRVVSGTPGDRARPATPTRTSPAGPSALRRRTITAEDGLELLRRGGELVGRLAISVAGEPFVFPLNYALDGDTVVFRTQVGTKLSGITRSLATFEVDHIDADGRGWTVTVEGLAQEVLDADPASLRARVDALALETWPGGDRPHVVRITAFAIRGTAWAPAEVASASEATPHATR